jgi:hypothetical protein
LLSSIPILSGWFDYGSWEEFCAREGKTSKPEYENLRFDGYFKLAEALKLWDKNGGPKKK